MSQCVITARNVHQALPEGLRLLSQYGQWSDSRAGRVIVLPHPVLTIYQRPKERMIFWQARDANPFFHFMEGFWMLAGRNDVAWIETYNSKMRDFSDDGVTFHGAYGQRWRRHFWDYSCLEPIDQLSEVVNLLLKTPMSRRAVIQMWDCQVDLHVAEKEAPRDIPCNTHIYLMIQNSCLDMTVMCRSNDIIWGAYGTNAVHFSMLQEYLAARIGVPIGVLYQLSNNFHAYEDVYVKNERLVQCAKDPYRSPQIWCPYSLGDVWPMNLVDDPTTFDQELRAFVDGEVHQPNNKIFDHASRLRQAFMLWKFEKDYDAALALLEPPKDGFLQWDIRQACREWIQRRKDRADLRAQEQPNA